MDDVSAPITESERLARWYGTWTGDPDAGFVMVTMFVQTDIDPAAVGDIAAGWRWYLDRLGASIVGATPPTLDDFETTYLDA